MTRCPCPCDVCCLCICVCTRGGVSAPKVVGRWPVPSSPLVPRGVMRASTYKTPLASTPSSTHQQPSHIYPSASKCLATSLVVYFWDAPVLSCEGASQLLWGSISCVLFCPAHLAHNSPPQPPYPRNHTENQRKGTTPTTHPAFSNPFSIPHSFHAAVWPRVR